MNEKGHKPWDTRRSRCAQLAAGLLPGDLIEARLWTFPVAEKKLLLVLGVENWADHAECTEISAVDSNGQAHNVSIIDVLRKVCSP